MKQCQTVWMRGGMRVSKLTNYVLELQQAVMVYAVIGCLDSDQTELN
ncbi:MAG: hypothetical protein ACJZ8E_05635 [Pseudohongiellaceae bacterium]